jgi:uncharacterized membrane protein
MTANFTRNGVAGDGAAGARLPAIDAMRGIVMVLMALDHASYAFNAGRYARDAYQWYPAGAVIPPLQFMTRWITHLCAPTFLFLAGFALALHVSKRQVLGHSEGRIDGDIVKRGIFILLLDPLWMSFGFGGGIVLQVLFCIGAGLCFMVLLRRLGILTLMILSLAILFLGEAVSQLPFWNSRGAVVELIGRSMFSGGPLGGGVYVLYPIMPWLGYMLLGWICGNHSLTDGSRRAPRLFLSAGLVSLGVFLVARGVNQYGNMLLYRYDHSIVQWLHVSKYPPSLTFSALELGLMFIVLAFLFLLCKNGQRWSLNPLYVFGRTPLFFYLLHVHMLALAARLLGMYRSAGLIETLIATFAVLLLMYPLCRWYFTVKRSRPESVLRYV